MRVVFTFRPRQDIVDSSRVLVLGWALEPRFLTKFPSFQVTTETKENIKCVLCSKEFKTKRGLNIHVTRTHKEEKKPKLHPLQLKSCVERSVMNFYCDYDYRLRSKSWEGSFLWERRNFLLYAVYSAERGNNGKTKGFGSFL